MARCVVNPVSAGVGRSWARNAKSLLLRMLNAAVTAERPAGLRELVSSRTWFHTIDLGEGLLTPGQKDTPTEVAHLKLPNLSGKTVLDIGAYDGFYSFESERRGAKRVLAADHLAWNWPGSDARGNFELAHQVLGSRVETVELTVEDISPEAVGGTFDVVLFLGVLYHAPDPLGYLSRVRSVTAEVAIIETVVDMLDVPVPATAFYEGESMNGDASNHFGPNPAAVKGMLLDAGFSRVEAFEPWTVSKEYGIQTGIAGGGKASLRDRVARRLRPARSGRAVFHAYV
jgi:tRNA (mo5U34)-methyltransferase